MSTPLHPSPFLCSLSLPLRGLSYHSESDVEHEPVTDKPATNGISMWFNDTPIPTVDAAHVQYPSVPDDESTATTRPAIAQVAPATPAPRRGGEGGRRGLFESLLAASRPAHTDKLS